MPCSAEPGPAGRRAWVLFGVGLLLLPSLLVQSGGALAARLLDAEPALLGSQPWRCWSAAWVHWSRPHLLANVAGLVLVLALGWMARVPSRAVTAWALAWPLVQCGVMLLQPALRHYGGLSGVLHAGLAVVVVWLLARPGADRREVRVGAALLAGLLLKLAGERFWRLDTLPAALLSIDAVPLAHALGVAAGLLAALVCRVPGSGVRRVPAA